MQDDVRIETLYWNPGSRHGRFENHLVVCFGFWDVVVVLVGSEDLGLKDALSVSAYPLPLPPGSMPLLPGSPFLTTLVGTGEAILVV